MKFLHLFTFAFYFLVQTGGQPNPLEVMPAEANKSLQPEMDCDLTDADFKMKTEDRFLPFAIGSIFYWISPKNCAAKVLSILVLATGIPTFHACPPHQTTVKCKGKAWKNTGKCDPRGPLEPDKNRWCDTVVPDDVSGYCLCVTCNDKECNFFRRMEKGCTKGKWRTCEDACTGKFVLETDGAIWQHLSGKPCAKLYEHSDFKGWVEEVNEGWGRMPYRNDQISSVKVNRDCWLTAYDDYKRKHKMFTVDARIANWGRYGELRGLGSYNDKMSAYECECN